jgi:hypothetical protein
LYYSRKISLFLLSCLIYTAACCQGLKFSFAADLGIAHNFAQQQQYITAEQNLAVHFHFTPVNGAYTWFELHGNGKFNNDLTATAKSPATTPQEIAYNSHSSLSFRHFSLGWKRYIKGTSDAERGWNLYSLSGLGLLMGQVSNTSSIAIDTTAYNLPVRAGDAKFKRLTLDLGLGTEFPLGGDLYIYVEGKTLIPITDNPSSYMLPATKYAPLTASLHLGLRMLLFN